VPSKQRANAPIAFGALHPCLDEMNLRLLAELYRDPRLSMSGLARLVGMSAPAVTERVRRMQDDGVITGFQMLVDPGALGLPVTAWVRIKPVPGQLPKLMEQTKLHTQVSECHRITGEDCLLVKLHAATIEGIQNVLDDFLLYGQTITSIVVSSPVPSRPLPLPSPG
jgi:Lrp/AsnC family transcriptional regulator, leucine-responsive regulatory protein